jgi:hypothetical protein
MHPENSLKSQLMLHALDNIDFRIQTPCSKPVALCSLCFLNFVGCCIAKNWNEINE